MPGAAAPPAAAAAQDPPVTRRPAAPPGNPRPAAEVLPAVPATASDPAPPDNRVQRVDRPDAPGAPGDPAAAPSPAARRRAPGVVTIEGVVVAIDEPGDDLNRERLRIVIDTKPDWGAYASGVGAEALEPAAEGEPKAEAEADGRVELIVTQSTYVYQFARTPEGVDQYRDAGSPATAPTIEERPRRSNFTNIKEGSFVAVRYRKLDDANQALNLSLIDLPLLAPDVDPNAPAPAATPPATGRPAARPTVPPNPGGGAPGPRRRRPGRPDHQRPAGRVTGRPSRSCSSEG